MGKTYSRKIEDIYIEFGKRVCNLVTPQIEKFFKDEYNIFLVGRSLKEETSVRKKVHKLLKANFNKINVHFPEELFEELLFEKDYDLLTLENMLAESVDAVVLCVESSGSIAELGAFSNSDALKHKLIIYVDKRYQNDSSFVRLGPLKYVQKFGSKVKWIDFSKEFDRREIQILKDIREIKKRASVKADLSNPLFAVRYLLALLYILGECTRKQIIEIIKSIESEDSTKEKKDVEYTITIVRASLSMLVKRRELILNVHGKYSLSSTGKNKLLDELKSHFIYNNLDKMRLEMLNLQLRKFWV